MSRLLYIARKVVAIIGGFGLLYNWWCTQVQTVVNYGYLYNQYAATDIRGIASVGAHVPSDIEWNVLGEFYGGWEFAGGHLKEIGLAHWASPNGNADNISGFNGRGAGTREGLSGVFSVNIKVYCFFHSSTEYINANQAAANLRAANGIFGKWSAGSTLNSKRFGASIRLIIDTPIEINGNSAIYVGNDLRRYNCVLINGVWWLADNLMETKYRNGDLIPEVADNTAWSALITGGRCSYGNVESNAGSVKRLASSEDWIIPADTHFLGLVNGAIGSETAGGRLKEIGLLHWNNPNMGATNEYGFNGRGAGKRDPTTGEFSFLKMMLMLRSNTVFMDSSAITLNIMNYSSDTYPNAADDLKTGASIRLCNPSTLLTEGQTGTYIQNDGTVLNTVVINGVEWISENLKETKWDDGTDIEYVEGNTEWAALTTAAYCYPNGDIKNK